MNILNQLFLAVILGLGGWIWYQGSTIDEMTAENQAQAQTIKQQEEANQALNLALQQEREAVIEQQQRNDEIERVALVSTRAPVKGATL